MGDKRGIIFWSLKSDVYQIRYNLFKVQRYLSNSDVTIKYDAFTRCFDRNNRKFIRNNNFCHERQRLQVAIATIRRSNWTTSSAVNAPNERTSSKRREMFCLHPPTHFVETGAISSIDWESETVI